MVENNYYGFAENDYQFFKGAYETGLKGAALAALGQSICERYLKHLIDEYANPENEVESSMKQTALRTHNLKKLQRYIQNDMGISIPEDVQDQLDRIDGFYFTTRYPGDDSFVPTERDIDNTWAAVQVARGFTNEVIHQMEQSHKPSCLEFDEPEL